MYEKTINAITQMALIQPEMSMATEQIGKNGNH